MFSYLLGEIYRLIHKKSMYLYFGAIAAAYLLIIFFRSGGFSASSVVDDAISTFMFLPVLVGGFFFAAVYTDDLNSKNLTSLVGFGMSKAVIVIVKLLVMVLFCAVVFAFIPLLHCIAYNLLGWAPDTSTWIMVYLISLKFFLMSIGFSTLSGILVYGLQRPTLSIILYVILAFGIVGGLLTTALNSFAPSLAGYLMAGITDRIMSGALSGGSLLVPFVAYIIYVAIAAALSILAFYKKEMEF